MTRSLLLTDLGIVVMLHRRHSEQFRAGERRVALSGVGLRYDLWLLVEDNLPSFCWCHFLAVRRNVASDRRRKRPEEWLIHTPPPSITTSGERGGSKAQAFTLFLCPPPPAAAAWPWPPP